MRLFSVSYMATKNDNGTTVSFTTREAAEECRAALIADGCVYVSSVW